MSLAERYIQSAVSPPALLGQIKKEENRECGALLAACPLEAEPLPVTFVSASQALPRIF